MAKHRLVPSNSGLLELIRAKREWDWWPSAKELKMGFRGWHQRGYLPHFDAPGVTQFVTFQLHDSFPVQRNPEFEPSVNGAEISAMRKKIEAWLDRGRGMCWLRQGDVAEMVEATLREGSGRDYFLQSWVVMPNHVHLVLDVWEVPLVKLVNLWKGKSARGGNKILSRRGPFWQEDYFDTLVRDQAHLKSAIKYTEQNPNKAFLVKAANDWRWSSARCRGQNGELRSNVMLKKPEF